LQKKKFTKLQRNKSRKYGKKIILNFCQLKKILWKLINYNISWKNLYKNHNQFIIIRSEISEKISKIYENKFKKIDEISVNLSPFLQSAF